MNISDKILKFAEVFGEILISKKDNLEISEELEQEANVLIESIIQDLVENPGQLIYYENQKDIELAKLVIKILWDTFEPEAVFDEMVGGKYTHILVDIMGEYTDRIKLLKPSFISINPEDKEFYWYYREAMSCWLFGLNNSALIICCSLLESLLKEKLEKINPEYVHGDIDERGIKRKTLYDFIDYAKFFNIISDEEKDFAHRIRKLRNDSAHKLQMINYKETYEIIQETKKFIERFLAKDSN